MHSEITIAASILSADFASLGKEVEDILKAGANVIHFDVMDHHFVPNLSFGSIICSALRKYGITAPIDVHLMVTDPEKYIIPFAKAGANRLTFHPETVSDVKALCDKIHDADMQAGLAFNPDKEIQLSKEILSHIDMILIMSVFPGFGGQSFIQNVFEKIKFTRQLIDDNNPKILLGIDGGIKLDNFAEVVKNGANFIVIGSGLFETNHYAERIKQFREQIDR